VKAQANHPGGLLIPMRKVRHQIQPMIRIHRVVLNKHDVVSVKHRNLHHHHQQHQQQNDFVHHVQRLKLLDH